MIFSTMEEGIEKEKPSTEMTYTYIHMKCVLFSFAYFCLNPEQTLNYSKRCVQMNECKALKPNHRLRMLDIQQQKKQQEACLELQVLSLLPYR